MTVLHPSLIPSISETFLKLFIFLRSYVLNRLATHEAFQTYSFFGENKLVPFHLRQRETLLKREKYRNILFKIVILKILIINSALNH